MNDADIIREFIEARRPPGTIPPALAALDDLVAVRSAAEWLLANRGHRGEEQAWRLLEAALEAALAEDTDE